MEFGGSLVVGGRRFLCTYTVQYSTVQKLFENSFRRFRSRSHALSSGLTSKNASKKNSHQAAKETAHVNATR